MIWKYLLFLLKTKPSMLLILQWFVAYIHSWGKCQISFRSERKWGCNFFKSQLMDPLNFLHGSQVENPALEEESYRRVFSVSVYSSLSPDLSWISYSPSLSPFPAVSISSLYLSFLTSSSHSLPSLHFLFSFSIIYFSVHSAHDHQEQALELVCSWQTDEVWAKREIHPDM